MHAKFIASAACVIAIIMDVPTLFCKPKQIDLQAFFVATAATVAVYLTFKMRIRHIEQIFSLNKVVPVDVLPVFQQILLQCCLSRCVFTETINFLVNPYY